MRRCWSEKYSGVPTRSGSEQPGRAPGQQRDPGCGVRAVGAEPRCPASPDSDKGRRPSAPLRPWGEPAATAQRWGCSESRPPQGHPEAPDIQEKRNEQPRVLSPSPPREMQSSLWVILPTKYINTYVPPSPLPPFKFTERQSEPRLTGSLS